MLPISWKSVRVECPEEDSILRSGPYALVFESDHTFKRTLRVVNLDENQRIEKRILCESREYILAFKDPYVLTRHNETVKLWDITSSSRGPQQSWELERNIGELKKGDVYGNYLILLTSRYNENDELQHFFFVNTINCEEAKPPCRFLEFGPVDSDTALLAHENSLFFSTFFGTLFGGEIENYEGSPFCSEEELDQYLSNLNPDTVSQYRQNVIRSLVADENRLAGSSEKAIKIWDIKHKKLEREFLVEERYTLLALEGRFLFGYSSETAKTAKIWDIFNCTVLYSTQNRDLLSVHLPAFTMYKNSIYYLEDRAINEPGITLDPSSPELDPSSPYAYFDDEEEIRRIQQEIEEEYLQRLGDYEPRIVINPR